MSCCGDGGRGTAVAHRSHDMVVVDVVVVVAWRLVMLGVPSYSMCAVIYTDCDSLTFSLSLSLLVVSICSSCASVMRDA